MWDEKTKKALLNVCKKYTADAPENVIFTEPYLPYVPENWNGILVLAESQMIRNEKDKYAQWLQELRSKPEHVMTRLGRKEPRPPYPNGPEKIGIGPWDDGTIKLALKAIFIGAKLRLKLENVGVSNAVPWTRGSGNNSKNLNSDEQMKAKATEFWEATFDVWQPDIKALVVLGNVAERVMRKAGILEKYGEKCLRLRLPSPNAINRVHGMFDCADLKARFPEVQAALGTLKMSERIEQYKMKVFFACHAVSRGKRDFQNWFGGRTIG
jgi:hypothetical protein